MYHKCRCLSKCILFTFIVYIFMQSMAMTTFAMAPYNSYTYDSYGNAVLSPNLYEPEQVVFGADMGAGFLIKPEDLFIDKTGNIYVLDTGYNRIVVADTNFKLIKIIDKFYLKGEESPLSKASGLFVDEKGNLFIADTGNNRVICAKQDGTIFQQIIKPDSEYFSESVEFLPKKVVVDRAGNLYVSSTGIYQGLIVFDYHYAFQGFFGSEKVVTTAKALSDFFWKQFMTAEQKEAMANYVPPEMKNIDITSNDFIFTITNSPNIPLTTLKTEMDTIRRLNPKGADTLPNKMLPLASRAMKMDARNLSFTDICSDDYGFINVIDRMKGKIYQFDTDMNLITAFGASGSYKGAFMLPAAIDTYSDKIYVLDTDKASITVFSLTDYGQKVHNAVKLYNSGKYQDAIGPWNEVLQLNTNCDLAYVGIGKALLNQLKYKDAMYYFELGRDSAKYNEAYKEYRIQVIRSNFNYIVIAALLVILLLFVFRKRQTGSLKFSMHKKGILMPKHRLFK